MRSFFRPFACLAALTMFAPATAHSANVKFTATDAPAGFDDLAGPREVLVDLYFGSRKVGETMAVSRPGDLRFRSPADVVRMIPGLIAGPEVSAALAAELPANSQEACSVSNAGDCGILEPRVAGIIYDEDRFRVDLFVNPKFLSVPTSADGYLPVPQSSLSLVNSFGLTASGATGSRASYNIQNRTIVGLGSARVRANTSVASSLGLVVDDLVGEVDRKDLRFSAGLFWSPGNDFTGQRRMIGAGVGTQFDTSAERESLQATPLVLFLAQPARVEILVDGRLVTSGSYTAGNNALDTTGLPSGSYVILLRIQQSNGTVREERRFFVKNAQIPPQGHPVFYAYAGLLANTKRHQPISPSKTFYYQAGTAWRLTNHLAVDASLLGTGRKTIFEAGTWLIKGSARFRVAALASTAGDAGGLFQAGTTGQGPVSLNFDLRRIWSRDGKPLIPLPTYANTFDSTAPSEAQLANGSYTQATGSIGVRLGAGYLSVVGSYRKDRRLPADYTVGPSINWPLVSRGPLQIVLEASAQRTRTSSAGFAGLRLLYTPGFMSVQSRMGYSVQKDRAGSRPSVSRAVSSYSAQYSHESGDRTLINLEGGVDRDIASSTLHGGGDLYSRFGHFRADLLHNLEGASGTQYNLAFQSGIALGPQAAVLGTRDIEQSAMVVSVDGDAADAQFDVLIDEVARGRVKPGRPLSLFVPGYRTYKVRLVPTAASSVTYDAAARDVTLYPGNVRALAWRADSYFTIFAQAMSANGSPIANALVQTAKGVAETDSNGYFQIDMRRDDPITISDGEGPGCRVELPQFVVEDDFASVGNVVCR